jgi:hypothetical protein
MSVLDEWNRQSGGEPSTSPSSREHTPVFATVPLLSNVTRGRGHVVSMGAVDGSVYIGTSKNYLIRYEDESGRVDELKLDCVSIKKLFTLDDGRQLLVTVHDGKNLETLCVSNMKSKPRVVKGLQGRFLTSAARCGAHTVVGSDTGLLYGADSPAGPFGKLLEIPQQNKRPSPVSGLISMESDEGVVLMALCGTYVHCFTLTSWFDDGVQVRPVELPIIQDAAQMQARGSMERLAVLSTSGVHYGRYPSLESFDVILFSHGAGEALPMSMALTKYHVILLYPTKLQFINLLSKEIVQEISIDGPTVGLSRDVTEGRVFLLIGDEFLEIDCSDEDREMWWVYLSHDMHDQALPLCRTAEQRNTVYLKQAQKLFDRGQYEESARKFGRMTSKTPSFDEIACKFLNLEDAVGKSSLRFFLEARLGTLSTRASVQRTMVSTWLLELLLNIEEENYVAEFVEKYADCLHPRTTASILEGYGRTNLLIAYSRARNDLETEIEVLMSAGNIEGAIGVLRKPSSDIRMVYKYAGSMLKHDPVSTVSLWMFLFRQPDTKLDTHKVLHAMMPYAERSSPKHIRAEIIRYLNFAIDFGGFRRPEDAAIHDMNVALLALDEENEDRLLKFIQDYYYLLDLAKALYVCSSRGRAVVEILVGLGQWNDAVNKSLELGDVVLARRIARECDIKDIRRHLFIAIVQWVLRDGSVGADAIPQIMEESGCISLDDLVSLLPDLERMGEYKSIICTSMQKYRNEIRERNLEIKLALKSNTTLRQIPTVSTVVSRHAGAVCASCSLHVLDEDPPASAGPSGGLLSSYYAFPTGNFYHGSCLCYEVTQLVSEERAVAIKNLAKTLSEISPRSRDARHLDMKRNLEEEIAGEDPFCGEQLAAIVTMPFSLPDEDAEKWRV